MQPVDPKAAKPLARKDHYAQLAKSGIKDSDAELPDFPKEAAYIWSWFNEIKNACDGDLKPSDIESYFRLKRINILPFELDAIYELNSALKKVQRNNN